MKKRACDYNKIIELYQKGLNCEAIAYLLNIDSATARYALKINGLRTYTRINRRWAEEDVAYLEKYYAARSNKYIAKRLGRTEAAVAKKAQELKLGYKLSHAEGVTLTLLLKTVFPGYMCGLFYNRMKSLGIPYKEVRLGKQVHFVVDVNQFFKWAYPIRDKLNFSGFEENALGKEPAWVKEKRSADRLKKSLRRWNNAPTTGVNGA